MSYAAIQALVSGKRPIWLYRIKRGDQVSFLTSRAGGWLPDFNYFAPTNLFAPQITDFFAPEAPYGLRWEAAAVKHSKINQTSRSKAAEVELTLPNSHPVARQFLDMTGLDENSVTIWHGYEGDKEMAVKFRGRVVSRKATRTQIVLVCENNFTALRGKGLSAVVQRPCRHALYHGGCGLKLADWQANGTATGLAGSVLSVTAAGSRPNGHYSGGVVEFNGAVQMITKHVGTSLTLLGVLPGLREEINDNGTAQVKIAAGCNRTMANCREKFGNIDNFGGFPWMSENPFDGRSVL